MVGVQRLLRPASPVLAPHGAPAGVQPEAQSMGKVTLIVLCRQATTAPAQEGRPLRTALHL